MMQLFQNAVAVYVDGFPVKSGESKDQIGDADLFQKIVDSVVRPETPEDVAGETARFPILNLSNGYFETMRLTGGTIPLWPLHKERLLRSAAHTGIHLPDLSYLSEICARHHGVELRARLTIFIDSNKNEHSILSLHPLPQAKATYSLQLASRSHPFTDEAHSQVKLSARAFYNDAFQQARADGYDDALLYDSSGYISETCIANILYLDDQTNLCTPSISTMPIYGVALTYIVGQMSTTETPVKETMLSVQCFQKVRAMWILNALRGVLPVTRINDITLATDQEITDHLQSLLPF